MPLEPGEDVVINLQNDTPVAFVRGNCWIFYSVTEDGFRDFNYSKECYEWMKKIIATGMNVHGVVRYQVNHV